MARPQPHDRDTIGDDFGPLAAWEYRVALRSKFGEGSMWLLWRVEGSWEQARRLLLRLCGGESYGAAKSSGIFFFFSIGLQRLQEDPAEVRAVRRLEGGADRHLRYSSGGTNK